MACNEQGPTEENHKTVNEIHFNSIELIADISREIRRLAADIKALVDSGFQAKIYNHRDFGDGLDAFQLQDKALFEYFKGEFEKLYSLVFPNDEKTQEQHETWFKICWHILAYSQMRHMQNWTSERGLQPNSMALRTALFNMEVVDNLAKHSCDYETMPLDYVIRCLTGMQ